jgi:chromatin segregation and condensation protein Rec8/ScpA/Scc1 (kleisin family)
VQNHVEGFVVQPVKTFSAAEARVESGGGSPEESHFFIAVCALAPQTGAPTFVYLPRAANILRERELHIAKLEDELAGRNEEIRLLAEAHQRQTEELEEHNRWAERLNEELEEARAAIAKVQWELESKTAWALRVDGELTAKCEELARCVEQLHQTEKTVEERTKWALDLRLQIQELERRLASFRASRWVRLGKSVGLGPEARDR